MTDENWIHNNTLIAKGIFGQVMGPKIRDMLYMSLFFVFHFLKGR